MEIINLARTGRVWISPRRSVGAALSQMAKEKLPGLVILDNGRICGITTLLDLASLHPNRLLLDAHIMEAVSFPETMDVVTAWQTTREKDSALHPVIDHEGSLKGLLTREDLLGHVCCQQNKAGPSLSGFDGYYILIAGLDDAENGILPGMLGSVGYRVETASSSREIMIKIRTERPDLVLLDGDPPGKNGYDILKEIKSDSLLQALPVIMVMSAAADAEIRNRAFEAGADDVLLKPLVEREVLIRVRQHLTADQPGVEGERNLDEIYPGLTGTDDIRDFNERIIENMGSGLMVMDNQGLITKYNQIALSMLGLPPDKDLTGRPITDIHPALAAFKTVPDSYRTLTRLEYPARPGRMILLGFVSGYLPDNEGKPQGIVTLFRDLTDWKEHEERLSRSEATLRALMNATTERMLLTDINGVLLAANQVFAETVGKNLDELIGNCVWRYFSPEVVSARKIHVDKMVETGQAVCFEDTRNGRHLESCMYPILDSRGQVELVATFSRDVTEARLAAMNLEKQQEETLILKDMMQNVMDNMMTGLLVTDTAGNISLINRSALEILDITEEKCLGKPIESISADLVVFREAVPPKASGHEVLARLAKGQSKPLGFSSTPFLEINGKKGVITVFKDLTEIQEMQKVLKVKERLATIGEFSRNIAHEIKNPLFSISASLQTLERNVKRFTEVKNSGNDPTFKLFDILYAETERINRLLDTLSQMGRNQHLCLERVNLEDLLEFVLMENTGLIAEKNLRVNRYFSKTMKRIRADRDKIIQIISNLLLNAIAFSPAGGEITLSLQNGTSGSTIEFSVGDAGPGIAENDLEAIFEPFFSTRPDGSGLGLAITRWIVELHGGTIFAKNKKTRGALFIVTLPCVQKGEV